MLTHTAMNLELQAVHAADLRHDAASYRMAQQARRARQVQRSLAAQRARRGAGQRGPVPVRALRDQLGWSLVQLGLRLVDRPTGHPLVQP